MATLFESMPGVQMPLSQMEETFSHMWEGEVDADASPPSDFRASQMNLILHFGLKTSAQEAQEKFNLAVTFAQKYPARIIVLCPEDPKETERNMEGKLFAQCYLVGVERQMCCLEAIIVGYQRTDAGFLDNTVSVWLDNDLPTYHWFNRVPEERMIGMHSEFIKKHRRVIIDSAIEGKPLYQLDWPVPDAVRDLAYARTLPYRQSIGQFLSSVEPSELVDGLTTVTVSHCADRKGEAEALLMWLQCCLMESRDSSGVKLTSRFDTQPCVTDTGNCLEVNFSYAGTDKSFTWSHCTSSSESHISSHYDGQSHDYPLRVPFMRPELALAEACFF